ncbi:MAG TPA: glycosyl hydrolase, partial [Candidatus Izemoplasmatales bacterium]|nr:glycosyl hydrolase [Candidatus Izemoplasmatales bacterium]
IPIPTTELPTTTEFPTTLFVDGIDQVTGIKDHDVIVGHYFNPMLGVRATSNSGLDITAFMTVQGHVDYGTLGDYDIVYSIAYKDDFLTDTVTVRVIDGVYTEPEGARPILNDSFVVLNEGSYSMDNQSNIAHPINPIFLKDYLYDQAIPSSGWWTSLLVENYGGGNGIYTNPLRVAFSNQGMEITNPLDGFVQYWNPEGYQTIAQFPIALKDTYLRSSDLNAGYITEVIDYSDGHVKVSMKNSLDDQDEVVVSLVQGSPYVFAETANKNALTLSMDSGVLIEYYDLSGNKINNNTYDGEAIIVKLVQRHSGYDTSPPANVGQPQYTDKFYLVNAPQNSSFSISDHLLSMALGDGNYISIVAINDVSEAHFYHQHGYTMIQQSTVDYVIDYEKSNVITDYVLSTQSLDQMNTSPLLSLMPHHYKYSDAVLTDYSYRTVRGTLKVFEGSHFQTQLNFNGLLPGYTLPDNELFSSVDAIAYLQDLNNQTAVYDDENFLNNEGPYWNSKALYPLSQGLIMADQLGQAQLKQDFIDKLRYLLVDWYSYNGSSDEKFLHYNNDWGSVYYSNDDFATASTLSDHAFTHGYLIYASAVLAMYDQEFVENYGLMVDLLLDDYMYPHKGAPDFAYLRNFDPWAGHTWAHGFGTFAEGNNLESTSEALNSWNAGYLWALATQDQDRMDAAIYGFATEISAIKEYWFDYDEENWDPAYGDYVDVAGMVWGGKHDYATWFGANPTFIYGIQWLPTGEYLTNYALNDEDYQRFSEIYQSYLDAKRGTIDTWYSNMWAIQAIIDPNIAINKFDANLILNDDYPAELSGSYWM